MIRITLKGVRGHLLRFLLTVAAVTLGTALIAGTYVLTDSINKTFDQIFDQSANGVDVSVRGRAAGEVGNGSGQAAREQLPIDLVNQLRAVPGVRRAQPDVQGTIILVGKDGTAVRNGGAPTLGFGYVPGDPALRLVAGRAPQSAGEVAADTSTLELAKLHVGDRTQALVGGEPQTVTITGEVHFDTSLAGATLVVLDEHTAQAVFAPDGRVSSFSVRAEPGVSQQQLRDRIAPILPPSAEAITGAAATAEAKQALHDALGFISYTLLGFAGVSVFVGGFIIFNTFSMLVGQRTRELALLRALGAAQPQVLRVVLGEALVVGLAGGLVGLGVGAGLARGLQALFGVIGLKISAGLPILPRTVIVTLLVGVLVTLLAATLPALRAARIAPVEALRDDHVQPPRSLRLRGGLGLALLAAGVVLVVPVARQASVNWWLFLLAAVLLVIGALVAAPLATRPVIRTVGAPFVWTLGTVGRLARENGLRVPRRTAVTATALMIGLTLMAGISVVAQSAKASISGVVQSRLSADFVLNGGQTLFPPTLAQQVARVPGVQSTAAIGVVGVSVAKDSFAAIATDAGALSQSLRVDMRSGTLAALDAGDVVVDGKTATAKGWRVGTVLTATLGTLRDQRLRVGAVTQPNGLLDTQLAIPRSLYTRAVPPAQQGDVQVYVKARPGTDLAALRSRLTETAKPYLVVSVQDGKQFVDAQASSVNTLLLIMDALLALSVIIAVLGIVNTLALSIFERTREIGLLRAVGLSRGQLSTTITIEAVSTALFGALLGTGLGLGLGVALRRALAGDGLTELAIPWGTLGLLIVVAAVAGVAAAVLPAIRAVRLDVLRAITTE